MSHPQFDRALMNTRLSKLSALAARFVLVDGMSQTGAARKVGIKHRQQVSRAVSCIRKAATAEGFCVVCGGKVTHDDDPRAM